MSLLEPQEESLTLSRVDTWNLINSNSSSLMSATKFLIRLVRQVPGRALTMVDMRQVIQSIFYKTAHKKQVMMFSATLSKGTMEICRKFMKNVSHQPRQSKEASVPELLAKRNRNQWPEQAHLDRTSSILLCCSWERKNQNISQPSWKAELQPSHYFLFFHPES